MPLPRSLATHRRRLRALPALTGPLLVAGALAIASPSAQAAPVPALVDGRYGTQVRELSHRVHARIHGLLAETEVTVALRSTSGGEEEGILTFHTPPGAVVTDLWVRVGARWVKGARLEASAVRKAIEDPRGLPSRVDPAWLEQSGPDRYRLRIYTVPTRGSVQVRYRYLHPVTLRWGRRIYVYPRRGRSSRLAPALVTLEDRSPFRAGLTKHQIRVAAKSSLERPLADPPIATATPLRAALYVAPGAARSAGPASPGGATGLAAVAARSQPASVGYALLLLQGNPDASRRRWGTDVVFLVDHSRSMWRDHRRSAEAVMTGVLAELGANTRFGLVAFGRRATPLAAGLRANAAGERARALGALKRRPTANGTSLTAGLAGAYRLLGRGRTARRRLVVLLTDGLLPEREQRDAVWPAAPAGTELLILVGRPYRGLSHRLRQGPLAALATTQGGLAYAFDPHQHEDKGPRSDAASHRATGALAASLARPGRLTALKVQIDGTPVRLPHTDLTLLGGHLAFHKGLGLPRQAVVRFGHWGQRRQQVIPARRMPAAWARHLRTLYDTPAGERRSVGPARSLVVIHPDDPFGRDRLRFAQRWGDRFFRRMAPTGELSLPVGPFYRGAVTPTAPRAGGAGKAFDEGRLTKKIVRTLLTTSYLKQATRCYQATGPAFKEGRAVLTMDLTRGEVTDAWIEHSTMRDRTLHRCLVDAALALAVARSWGDETLYRVTYPMRFRPADRSVDELRGWRPPRPRTRPNPLRGLRD